MTHLFVLWLALFTAQATTPVTQPAAPVPDQAASANPPSPNPDASGIYKIGGDVTRPRLLHQVVAVWTKIARQQKLSGVTVVSIVVDTQGNPTNAHISKSMADSVDQKHREAALSLDQTAIDAVKQYRFKPAMKDGKPVAVYLNVEVNFDFL
jgi:TonB family protein